MSKPTRFVMSLVIAVFVLPAAWSHQTMAPPSAKRADKLQANLWMEISGEYRAICFQTFNTAFDSVKRQADLAPRVNGRPAGADGRPLAVVADLDETILDNSGYNSRLAVDDQAFSPDSWADWVTRRFEEVKLVPGAKRFIERTEKLGVRLVYISNRSQSRRDATIKTLKRLGIATEQGDPWLLLEDGNSDKTERRLLAQSHYQIVAYLGDNLEDFPDGHTDPQAWEEIWGERWFVFPNPVYGSWERPLRDRDPREALREVLRLRRDQ